MRRRALASVVAMTGVVAVVLLTAFGALAGHLNAVLTTDLDGRTEVATDATDSRIVGDPNGRAEAYVFGIDGDPTTLCYVLIVDGIATATAAHIHEGAADTNGPVVANLAAPATATPPIASPRARPGSSRRASPSRTSSRARAATT